MKKYLLISTAILYAHHVYAQLNQQKNDGLVCSPPFYHGVASGDPLTDRIIIWTRVTPDAGFTGRIAVNWRMATDTGMTQIVKQGAFITSDSIDFTVNVDVTGLRQNTYYYYDFAVGNKYSIRGRTHTMPASGTTRQRFATASCANWEDGYYNAYGRIAARNDISAVVFLGDYIYEYKRGEYGSNIAERKNDPPNECITLQDYRRRYAQYHGDINLIRCHQQYPWMIIWDDHEFADNAWIGGAENHTPSTEGPWNERKANAMRAWREWLPVRITDPNDKTKIYRKISMGGLINFYFLDGRITGRDKQVSYFDDNYNDTSRHMLGSDQLNWLLNDMQQSTAVWNIVCQQDMMAPCEAFDIPVSTDAWDGYPAERNRFIYGLKDRNINNCVVLTGDFHTSWGTDIPRANYDPLFQTNSAGVEFVGPSITSQNFVLPIPETLIKIFNPHVRFVDASRHGYMVFDVTGKRVTGEWWYVKTVAQPSAEESFSSAYFVQGKRRYLSAGSKTSSVIVSSPMAPACPVSVNAPAAAIASSQIINHEAALIHVYPNPFNQQLTFLYTADHNGSIRILLSDMQGRVLFENNNYEAVKGMNTISVNTDNIAAGSYVLRIYNDDGSFVSKLVVKAE